MNEDITTAVKVLAAFGGAGLFIWIGTVLMKAARRGDGGVRGIGAVMMLFGWGNMRDPRNDIVAEAQDGRIRKGTHSGDPLDREPPAP